MYSAKVVLLFACVIHWSCSQLPTIASANQNSDGNSSGQNYCGIRPPRSATKRRVRRVIGGVEARKHAWPWQVLLLNSSKLNCGGSIISPTWVITAAHCTDNVAEDKITLYAGRHKANDSDIHEQKLEIEKIYIHPDHKRGNGTYPGDYDLTLIKLKKPITITDYVRPICLPDTKTPRFMPGHTCVLAGWGMTNTSLLESKALNGLRQVRIPLVAESDCNSNESYAGLINERYLCAGEKAGGKDGCSFDSGGPLMCSHDDQSWYLTGMMAWGAGCAEPFKYGVYLNVSSMLDYITKNITDLPQPYPTVPISEATTKDSGMNKHESKERLFVAIICALCVIIVVLLATLAMVHFYGKGYICRMEESGRIKQTMANKSPKLIEANGKLNQEACV